MNYYGSLQEGEFTSLKERRSFRSEEEMEYSVVMVNGLRRAMNESATTATRHNKPRMASFFFQGVKPSSQIIEWWSLVYFPRTKPRSWPLVRAFFPSFFSALCQGTFLVVSTRRERETDPCLGVGGGWFVRFFFVVGGVCIWKQSVRGVCIV